MEKFKENNNKHGVGGDLCRKNLQFSHALFLGGEDDMELILEAFHKLRENTDELNP